MLALTPTLISAALEAYHKFSPKELAQHCLFYPIKSAAYFTLKENMLGGSARHVEFPSSNGALLHGVYLKKPNSEYTFLLHYGQGGNIASNIGLARMVLMSDQSVFAYDYQGYGMSDGKPSLKNMSEDGLAANDYLVKELGIDPSQIVQYGVSLGTGVASYTACRRKSAALVLFSPYTSLYELARERMPFFYLYPENMYPAPDIGTRPFFNVNEKTPVFIWHGEQDPIIGVNHTKSLAKICKSPLTLKIDSQLHHGDWSINEMSEDIKTFLKKVSTLKGSKIAGF